MLWNWRCTVVFWKKLRILSGSYSTGNTGVETWQINMKHDSIINASRTFCFSLLCKTVYNFIKFWLNSSVFEKPHKIISVQMAACFFSSMRNFLLLTSSRTSCHPCSGTMLGLTWWRLKQSGIIPSSQGLNYQGWLEQVGQPGGAAIWAVFQQEGFEQMLWNNMVQRQI